MAPDAQAMRAAPAREVSLGIRLFRGSAVYGATDLLQKALAFVLIPIYTHHLSTSEYGTVSVLSAVLSFLVIPIGLGLRGAVVRHYYDHRHDSTSLRSYMGTVVTVFGVSGVSVALLLTTVGRPLLGAVAQSVPVWPHMVLITWVSVFSATGAIVLSLYRAREQAWRYAALQLGQFLLTGALTVLWVAVLREGATGWVYAQAASTGILFLVFAFLLARESRPTFDASHAKAALAYSLPLVPHLLATTALAVLDRIYLERTVPLSEVGIYGLGYQIGMVVGLFATAVNAAWVPLFFDMAKRRADAPQRFARVLHAYAGILTCLAAFVILFSSELVAVLASESYAPAARIAGIVAFGYLFSGLYSIVAAALFYKKQSTRVVPVISSLAVAVNIGALMLLTPIYGIVGAAYATVAAFASLFLLCYYASQKSYPIPYSAARIATCLMAAGACLAIIPLSGSALNLPLRILMLASTCALLWLVGCLPVREAWDALRRRTHPDAGTDAPEGTT